MTIEDSNKPGGELRRRTKLFAVRIVKLYSALPKNTAAQVIGKQLLRSGTSVGAHYRESQRSRSSAEFISKLEVGLQELEETDYWIELLIECDMVTRDRLAPLKAEIQELLAMFTATVKTLKKKKK